MKTIADIMTRQVDTVAPSDNLLRAAELMRDSDVGMLPVTDGKKLVGVITDRDIAIRAVAEGKEPNITYVQTIMTSEVVSCPPDTEIRKAVDMMSKHQIRRLMIVDKNQELVGVIAQADVAREDSLDEQSERLVENVSQ